MPRNSRSGAEGPRLSVVLDTSEASNVAQMLTGGMDSTTASLVAPTDSIDEVSRQQLDKIKARTMYNMVEPIGNSGTRKMLFLTNAQATLLGKSPASLEKMLDRLEVGNPQLVINLLESRGFRDFTNGHCAGAFTGFRATSWAAGVTQDRPPFLTPVAERIAEGKIDTFMTEVLIPLAAETNAIVLCNAIPQLCKLSSSFLCMLSFSFASPAGSEGGGPN